MNKINLQILGRNKLQYFVINNIACVNIDKLITKFDFNQDRVTRIMTPIFNRTKVINFYGLPELVYRMDTSYNDNRVIQLFKSLKKFLLNINSECELVQKNISFDGYVDLKPLDKCIILSKHTNTLYVHRIIQDTLNMLGYQTSQFPDLLRYTNDLSKIIPQDIIQSLPIDTYKNRIMYDNIKNILNNI